ncbi:MAG: blue (type 1) copper domain [Rhizobiaceae bacterium]|jgi:plastocyanin|nr:blue (type 1) copper domain [Rhizobiaceae bacterium]
MIITRRRVLGYGGASLAVLLAGSARASGDEVIEVGMQGNADGSHVWFDPVGLHVRPGQTVRWTNRDKGNSHTVTAYHPDVFERPLRIPAAAKPFNSDYLLPDEAFSAVFPVEGVYDYYCVPHEHAGMVGRIVVGRPAAHDAPGSAGADLVPLPDVALDGFPSIEEILARGIVRRQA